MISVRHIAGIMTLALGMTPLASSLAQDAGNYPARPIHFIVPAAAGGPTDVVGRMLADKLGEEIGQTVVVENRPGGGMTLGATVVGNSAPDGYTLLFTPNAPLLMTPFVRSDLPYDVKRDFRIVTHVASLPLVVFVNTDTGINTLAELAEKARANPGKMAYGSYGVGSNSHILGADFSRQQNLDMIHVPYKGVAPLLNELAGGQILSGAADVGTARGLMAAGKIRGIAVSGTKRSQALPDVPTFAEQGVPGMEPFSPWLGVFAPAKTPDAIVKKVSTALEKVVRDPEFVERLKPLGMEATGAGVDKATEMMSSDLAQWERIMANLSHIKFE